MSDLPSKEELVEIGAKTLCELKAGDWDYIREIVDHPMTTECRRDASAILDAVLSLVMRGPAEALGQALRQWKLYADCFDPEHGDLDTDRTAEGDLYRRARTVRQWAEMIGGG